MRRFAVIVAVFAATVWRAGEMHEVDVGKASAYSCAIRGIQQLNVAEARFSTTFGMYATLTELEARGEFAYPPGDGQFAGRLGCPYRFTVELTPAGYTITATPENPRYRTFRSDQTLALTERVAGKDVLLHGTASN